MDGVKNKPLNKLEENEDRISDLPDSLIHHILSFLPSTKQAIQTGLLSKRWLKQWTHVPVLSFDLLDMPSKDLCRCIDNTLILHNCSKIKRFRVQFRYGPETDSQLTTQIRFTTMKCVEEINLDLRDSNAKYRLPNFLFSYSFLVQLTISHCCVVPNAKVNWGFLKILMLDFCELTEDAIKNVLIGSPSLESLIIRRCTGFDRLILASKSLKLLFLYTIRVSVIEISCSNLEELRLLALDYKVLKLMNAPCLIRAVLYLNYNGDDFEQYQMRAKSILERVGNVKELCLASPFIEILSTLKVGVLSPPLLNCKRLYLLVDSYKQSAGIAFALRNSPVIGTLLLKFVIGHPSDSNIIGENFGNSDGTVFNCLLHLKTVKIICQSASDCTCKLALNIIEFILKNARVLEKMVVVLYDKKTDSMFEVSNKLLSFPRCSPHAVVQLNPR